MDTRTGSVGKENQKHRVMSGERKTHAVVAGGHFVELELKVPDEGDQNASDLEVGKLRDS